MNAKATALILCNADDTQAEYAAAQKTPVSPARSLPPGETGPGSSGAVAVEAPALEETPPPAASETGTAPTAPRPEGSPRFEAVDSTTHDLLALVAEENPATPQEVSEWDYFRATLREVALATGLIDQNVVRPLLRGDVKPNRIGAFYCRAAREGLIRAEGWHPSDDLVQRNRGKPTRVYRWLGT